MRRAGVGSRALAERGRVGGPRRGVRGARRGHSAGWHAGILGGMIGGGGRACWV